MGCVRWIWDFRRYLILGLPPILFSPIPILSQTSESYTAYVIILVSVYWCTEVVDLAVTGLFPAVLLPLFGVLTSREVASEYFKDLSLLILAGLAVAVAIEETNLHKRIALRMLMWTGSSPKWLMFGLMLTTGLLSMWISNTATTAMMIQIVHALLEQMGVENEDVELYLTPLADGNRPISDEISADPLENTSDTMKGSQKQRSQKARSLSNLNKALLLCIPYAANVGGTATLTGTPPNLVALTMLDRYFGSAPGINFATWMIYATPGMLVCLVISWLWLTIYYLGCDCCPKCFTCCKTSDENAFSSTQAIIKKQYDELGPISFAEKTVGCHFIVMVGLWLTRDPRFIPGWSILFKDGYISDSTGALIVVISLFIFPSKPPSWSCKQEDGGSSVWNPILTWHVVNKKMPWGLYIFVGAGSAMAHACKVSGLSNWLGIQLTVLQDVNPWIVVLLSSSAVALFTEFTSNTSTASIILPIMVELSVAIQMNPLYIVLPSTIACSYAFMLPIATPPNAIAFSYGSLRVIEMVKSGAILNILCVIVANISINTLGVLVFDVHTFPEWAEGLTVPSTTSELFNTTGTV